jgi:hypothetical protein
MEEYEIVLDKAKGEMDIQLREVLDYVLNEIDEFLENKPGDYFDYGDKLSYFIEENNDKFDSLANGVFIQLMKGFGSNLSYYEIEKLRMELTLLLGKRTKIAKNEISEKLKNNKMKNFRIAVPKQKDGFVSTIDRYIDSTVDSYTSTHTKDGTLFKIELESDEAWERYKEKISSRFPFLEFY